jgi:ring-1,2-phenylacetyl-CoA epoxidase subunit PaaB
MQRRKQLGIWRRLLDLRGVFIAKDAKSTQKARKKTIQRSWKLHRSKQFTLFIFLVFFASFASKNVFNTMSTAELPLFEVFIRSKQGLEHKHCGSLHASDAQQALQMARDVYTRRMEGVSIWVVQSSQITASQPDDKDALFEPASDKIYRHPTFYDIPDEVGHM